MLTDTERLLYDRQLILPGFEEIAQEKLKNTKVLIVGAGGIGSPAAIYLAASGVGTLGIADADEVSLSNLQRQVLYTYADVGMKKVDVAAKRLSNQNPCIKVCMHPLYISESNIDELIDGYDIVVGALDNALARYLLNDACVRYNKVYIHGAISQYKGQITVFNYNGGKTYRDLFSEPISVSDTSITDKSVFSPLPGVIGTLVASEVIKVATECGEVLSGKMLLVDLQENIFQFVNY